MDKTAYEHRLYANQLPAGSRYLVARPEAEIQNLRWQGGEFIITCDKRMSGAWPLLRLCPVTSQEKYGYRVYGNNHDQSFARNLIASYGQRIKTRAEIERFLRAFARMEDFTLQDIRLQKGACKTATYSTETFIDYEFRTGSREYTLALDFKANKQDYRNVDVLSFLTTSLQHYFPEYTCAGRLV